FLARYYSIGKTSQMCQSITNFSQIEGESFYESWERLKELLRLCPHHDIPRWIIVQSFLKGLREKDRQLVNSACGGSVLRKSDDEIWALFGSMSEDSYQMESMGLSEREKTAPTHSSSSKKGGIYEVEQTSSSNQNIDVLTKKLNQLIALHEKSSKAIVNSVTESCSICSDPTHDTLSCPLAGQYPEYVHEYVNAAQGYVPQRSDPYSNTYNPGWANHPNFRWSQQLPPRPPTQPSQPMRPNYQGPNQGMVVPYRQSSPQNQYQSQGTMVPHSQSQPPYNQ
ncbi:hypothetical protein, partial [Modestobacter marinus]|uniref:hypothetical protein n=1 Tax=Modestobacter marinus TaxID=477641 RepID=UPI001C95382F